MTIIACQVYHISSSEGVYSLYTTKSFLPTSANYVDNNSAPTIASNLLEANAVLSCQASWQRAKRFGPLLYATIGHTPQGDRTILTRLLFLLHSVCPVAQGNPILSCSGEHGQQVVFVQTT